MLTATDPEPGLGVAVMDQYARLWVHVFEGQWYQVAHPNAEPETWETVAGDYGPVRVVAV